MVFFIRTVLVLAVVSLLAGSVLLVRNIESHVPSVSYNEFLQGLDKNEIVEVHFKGNTLSYRDTYGRKFSTFCPDVQGIVPELLEKGVVIHGQPDKPSPWWKLLYAGLPTLVILLAWYSFLKKPAKEDSDGFAKDKAVKFRMGEKPVTFRDVAGIPEVKDELLEIIDFLQKPKKYSRLGAIIPKGILFQGPPGTGKTLLARAIAGEAGVPFYSISGSDFVEMFVGVGASRVRELFREAKKNAPCIIFIDEIDAVGGHRGAGTGTGGQDERGQTLNALLVEMDGFSSEETIIVLAATNRPDILDPALLRPGRFDRQISILPPDVKGRLAILQVHARKVSLAKGVDLEKIARSTPGFTGAELAALVNEAAIFAGRQGKKEVDLKDFELAQDRIMMGVERKGLVIGEKDRKTLAYHEAGHALLAKFLPESDPVHKITIIPRGKALGYTKQLPMNDRHAYSKIYLRSRITMLLGGRAAEEICLDQQTTCSEDDFEHAVAIASKMVCRWGMDELIGPVSYSRLQDGFLGDQTTNLNYSEETARNIDREIKRLIDDCYQEALEILRREQDFLSYLAEILLINETLDAEEMEIIYDCALKRRKQQQNEGPAGQMDLTCNIGYPTAPAHVLARETNP